MWAVEVFLETWLWDSNMDSKTINSVDFTASKKTALRRFSVGRSVSCRYAVAKVSEIFASDN
jgi:hypothetical protein